VLVVWPASFVAVVIVVEEEDETVPFASIVVIDEVDLVVLGILNFPPDIL